MGQIKDFRALGGALVFTAVDTERRWRNAACTNANWTGWDRTAEEIVVRATGRSQEPQGLKPNPLFARPAAGLEVPPVRDLE